MIMHVLVSVHLGDTRLVHVCPECARTSPLRPLREPGTWVDDPLDHRGGYTIVGQPVTYETATGRCPNCGASDARVGYLRCCAACSRFYLLDHCSPTWPPPAFYCPRKPCQEARTHHA